MRGLPMTTRMKLAGKALTGLFSPDMADAAQGLLKGMFLGTQGTSPERGSKSLLDTFNTSPWARACAMRVADSLSATHWRLYVRTNQGKPIPARGLQKSGRPARKALLKQLANKDELREVETHILLDLLRDGNNEFSGPDLWWLHSIFMDLIGDAFYIKQRNRMNAPASLWPVPPHWVVGTPTLDDLHYRISYRGYIKIVPQTEMLWAKSPNPVNPYWRGSGLAKALDDELEMDEQAVKHAKSFFRNNAMPGVLVMPKNETGITPIARDQLEGWWNDQLQGYWRQHKPLFLNVPMEVKTFDQNFQSMQFSQLRSQEADIILQTWGIPPELFGRLSNSNRATITQAFRIFGQMVLVPRLERMRHWIQNMLVPEYDDRLILEYDSPIPEDWDFKLSVMKSQPTAFQLNEFRDLADLPLDDVLLDQYGSGGGGGGGFGAVPEGAALERLTTQELQAMHAILSKAAARQGVRAC